MQKINTCSAKLFKALLILGFVCMALQINAQTAPVKQWDKSIGGSDYDESTSLLQTSDGGYIVGGYSGSGISGDKSQASKGGADYWVVKFDAMGNKTWDKAFGGTFNGSADDYLYSMQQTSDGGYILGGSSWSDIGGDKTQASRGNYDYWVIKLDASGNKLWDKTFGGSGGDELSSLRQTADGGYILAGGSWSYISGDKSQASKGATDYWIVKLDGSGNKLWDKTIGGNYNDYCRSIRQTSDGGYILGGYSESDISGDKSQATHGTQGYSDYWIVKLDGSGNKLWDKAFGGNYIDDLSSLWQTSDGGYILGGSSQSGASGDKSEANRDGLPNAPYSTYDYWVIKLNGTGNKIWDKTFGGSGEDKLTSLQQTSDGGFILGGHSESGISGDKSEATKGGSDYWVVKLNNNGIKTWDKTFGGSNIDKLSSLQQTSDGGFILGGLSYSGISGDKSQASQGMADYWVVKLAAESYTTIWNGNVSTDWHDAANWSNRVPNQNADVIIPTGLIRYPIHNSYQEGCRNLTIESGASFTSNFQFFLFGKFTNNGNFISTNSSSWFNSYGSEIGGSSVTNFYRLSISKNTTLTGAISISGDLELSQNLTTNGNTLTLLSNSTGTAAVENYGGVVIGNVTVQRYIDPSQNSGLGYRHYASPVASTTLADLSTSSYTPVVNAAFNSSANPGTVRPYPTIFDYDQSRLAVGSATTEGFGFGWESPGSLSDIMVPGKGYTVNIAANQTVDFVGTLNNGNITVNNLNNGGLANSGWHLLGNPYPAPIDWNKVTKPAGMMDAVYAYRSSSTYNGTYASYVNGIGSLTNGIIPSMQAFFVRTTANVQSFIFTNACRTSTSNTSFYRNGPETRPLLQLQVKNAQNQQDETFLYLEAGATAGVDNGFDALKLNLGPVKCYTLAGTEALSINGLEPVSTSQQIPLVIDGAAGNWNFKVAQLINFKRVEVWLEDKLTQTQTLLTDSTQYAFQHAGGQSQSRFVLHLNPKKISGLRANAENLEVVISPNPSNGKFRISLANLREQTAGIIITDMLGRKLLQKELKTINGSISEEVEMPVTKGIYLLQIEANKHALTRKIIVE